MPRRTRRTAACRTTLGLLMIAASTGTAAGQDFAGREKLRAHTSEFRREVIKVADGVYVAVGFSLGNAILIQGDGGAIIVDTTSNVADARAVKAEFAKVSSAPVRAIVYTHFHADHVGGATVFAGEDRPEIYSHQLLVERAADIGRAGRDGGNQFGSALPESLYINAGIGPQIGRRSAPAPTATGGAPAAGNDGAAINNGYLRPTRTFNQDRMAVTIAGVRLELLHTPGETSDAISVWLPDKRILMPGDDFYRAFPNLYAIRGVRLRPVDQWVASLGKMIDLKRGASGAGHTRPIAGAASVRGAHGVPRRHQVDPRPDPRGHEEGRAARRARAAREAAVTAGRQPVPPGVLRHDRLVGPRHLHGLSGMVRRECDTPVPALGEGPRGEIVALAGGVARVLTGAREALAAQDFQWAAELADYVLAVDGASVAAKRLKAQALTELGERQISANARNYYLSAAQYLLRDLPPQ